MNLPYQPFLHAKLQGYGPSKPAGGSHDHRTYPLHQRRTRQRHVRPVSLMSIILPRAKCRRRCRWASVAELDAAVDIAAKAQPAWAATNPQRRARVLMAFVGLLNRDMDKLAEALSREHGKTIPDAKGDVQRGLEVVEYCIGAPELLKGDYTDGAGPGIDIYSMRQALGVSAGITPFNFPAMIPMWMFAPAIACGNAFILKPSERDPSVPLMMAELLEEAGLPKGIIQVVNGDKEAVDAIIDNDTIQSIGFVGSTPIAEYIYGRGCSNGKRVSVLAARKTT